jgi:hypothetical protein
MAYGFGASGMLFCDVPTRLPLSFVAYEYVIVAGDGLVAPLRELGEYFTAMMYTAPAVAFVTLTCAFEESEFTDDVADLYELQLEVNTETLCTAIFGNEFELVLLWPMSTVNAALGAVTAVQ